MSIISCLIGINHISFGLDLTKMTNSKLYFAYLSKFSLLNVIFQTGANSAFHEAIGETIILAAMTTANRKRLGFVSAQNLKNASEIVLERKQH